MIRFHTIISDTKMGQAPFPNDLLHLMAIQCRLKLWMLKRFVLYYLVK